MTRTFIALLALCAQVPDRAPSPEELTARLGSTRYAERRQAAEALQRLGRAALPALRIARDSHDLEVQTSTAAIIRKIEGSLLTEPTMVTLDFKDAVLEDVVKSLSDQTGFRIAVFPDTLPRLKTERVTLRSAGPIPFFEAVDLLCNAAQLRPNPGMISPASAREPSFSLIAGPPSPPQPESDHGPFRISLTRLHTERDVVFAQAAPTAPGPPIRAGRPQEGDGSPPLAKPVPTLRVEFDFQLQIIAEPRLSMVQGGDVQLLEAIDDAGNSLIESAATAPRRPAGANRFGAVSGSLLHLVVPLRRPESPGRSIRILKGLVPVVVAARRPDPLVVPFAGAVGKSFQDRGSSVVVHAIRKSPNQAQTTIELTVRTDGDPAALDPTDPADPASNFSSQAFIPRQQQLDVVDRQGRSLPWFQIAGDPTSGRMTMTLNQFGAGFEPTELRLYSLSRAAARVPFEFHDLPMP